MQTTIEAQETALQEGMENQNLPDMEKFYKEMTTMMADGDG